MTDKEKPDVVSAGRRDKSSYTDKNSADLRETQSPWSVAPADNFVVVCRG